MAAIGNAIGGSLRGIAVDAYGNVYFVDSTTSNVFAIYRGGAQVAAFITAEDPAGVATSGGVQVGYVYHVAGTISSSCTGTSGNVDNVLATAGQLRTPSIISLDSAGNLYITDAGNSTVRVVNTQATTQTFFQFAVPSGFIQAITNCNAALTGVTCPATTTALTGTGINGPANGIVL